MIHLLESIPDKQLLFSKDRNNREIYIYKLSNVQNAGINVLYSDKFYNPINEFVLSLNRKVNSELNPSFKILINTNQQNLDKNYFYFIYNQDNYYHYIYDTLPYLISYLHLKKTFTDLKLLMKKSNLKFVDEFLELLGITDKEICIISDNMVYSNVYISSSYTHSGLHNLPPRIEVYDLYQFLINQVTKGTYQYDKIYVSRRTWIQTDVSNIGTNYTIKRKLENEDELVEILTSKGFTEVFTETLTTKDKIWLFKNVKVVVGSIGGGICNVVFSKPECKLFAIISPTFLDINTRFLHSLKNVNLQLITSTISTETTIYKKYMRLLLKDGRIGEILDYKIISDQFHLKVQIANESSTGFINDKTYNCIYITDQDIQKKLDDGLNSSWKLLNIDMINFS